MQNSFKVYSEQQLPNGFKYPESYLSLSKNMMKINKLYRFPWWFHDAEDNLVELMAIYQELTTRNDLIPFARDGDWAACFDSADKSGNPKVIVYDLGNNEIHYEVENFDEWLNIVISEIN